MKRNSLWLNVLHVLKNYYNRASQLAFDLFSTPSDFPEILIWEVSSNFLDVICEERTDQRDRSSSLTSISVHNQCQHFSELTTHLCQA